MEDKNAWSSGWQSGMVLYGESREQTVIKLADNAKGFGKDDKQAVIRTGSENPHNPNGRGNQAFKHSLINLTIDTGKGNPGAVGIDYAVSNHGTIEFVTIRSGDGSGKSGLQLTREPGPGSCQTCRHRRLRCRNRGRRLALLDDLRTHIP